MHLSQPDPTVTLSQILEQQLSAEELARKFGYRLSRTPLKLPPYAGQLDRLDELRSRLEEILPYVIPIL